MPVDVAPQRGDAVDVALAVGVDEVDAGAALDHQRLLLLPLALLRERVPEMPPVELGDRLLRLLPLHDADDRSTPGRNRAGKNPLRATSRSRGPATRPGSRGRAPRGAVPRRPRAARLPPGSIRGSVPARRARV